MLSLLIGLEGWLSGLGPGDAVVGGLKGIVCWGVGLVISPMTVVAN